MERAGARDGLGGRRERGFDLEGSLCISAESTIPAGPARQIRIIFRSGISKLADILHFAMI